MADLPLHHFLELRFEVLDCGLHDMYLVLLGHLDCVSLFERMLSLPLLRPEGPRGLYSAETLQLPGLILREFLT